MPNASQIPFSGHHKLGALLPGSHFSLMDRAAARLAAWFDRTVPDGYEDETGFHLATARVMNRRVPVDDRSRTYGAAGPGA